MNTIGRNCSAVIFLLFSRMGGPTGRGPAGVQPAHVRGSTHVVVVTQFLTQPVSHAFTFYRAQVSGTSAFKIKYIRFSLFPLSKTMSWLNTVHMRYNNNNTNICISCCVGSADVWRIPVETSGCDPLVLAAGSQPGVTSAVPDSLFCKPMVGTATLCSCGWAVLWTFTER